MELSFLFWIVLGVVLLLGGAELLVRGASALAKRVGISPLVIGLTVVAYGTSAPEVAVSISAGFEGQPEIAVGNAIGSNIFNVLFILGISALLIPLKVSQQLILLDVPVMCGVAVLAYLLSQDGRLGRWDGILLSSGLLVYTVWSIRQSRKESAAVRAEYQEGVETDVPANTRAGLLLNAGLVIAGLAMLVLGSQWLVDGAVIVAQKLGVSELVIGLTIVAAGTSLPEVATSILAAARGERDIAVGNVVGSSIFNVLAVMGLASAIVPGGIPVSQDVLEFDFPVMLAVLLACLPVFFTGHEISRWEGVLFIGYYVAYTGYLVLDATGNSALPRFTTAMMGFVLPLTLVTLVIVTVRELRARRTSTD